MHRLRVLFPAAVLAVAAGCGGDEGTFDPGIVGENVRITVIGTVVSGASLAPVPDASVWIDLETPGGAEARGSARTGEDGRYALQFFESDCSIATERAFRVFARKKGFADAELTDDGNGGQPVLRCTTREQVIDLHLQAG